MNNDRRVARFTVSPRVLKEALSLPETAEIYGIEWSFSEDCAVVYVKDESFSVLAEWCPVPKIYLLVTEHKECVVTKRDGKWA